MEKIKVLLNGCNGKMGQEVVNCINKNEELEVICGFDLKDENLYPFPVYNNFDDI